MTYDLVIRNGTVIDGAGTPRYRADVGVKNGRIAAIGRINAKAKKVIDAEGHVVTPGFVDGHTHMDAQVFWDKLGSCSCYHGVTTVVMGNCGFTLAPCREADADLVFRNLERAEDISRESMLTGRRYGGTDALEAGIVHAAAAEGEVVPASVARAAELAEKPRHAVSAIKARLYEDALDQLESASADLPGVT